MMNSNRPDVPPQPPIDETRPPRLIFRAEAIRHYEERREKSVLPRFIAPRLFAFLWVIAGLLVLGGMAAWLTPVPIYASGPAVAVANNLNDPAIRDPVVLVAFLPAENLSRLRAGQAVFLQFTPTEERSSKPIIALEPEVMSPELARQRFGLGNGTAQLITQPAAVVIVRLEPISSGLPAATYVGSIYRADVEVGTRRVISLLPLVGQLFGE